MSCRSVTCFQRVDTPSTSSRAPSPCAWRQAKHTLTLLTTRAIEVNVDGLPPVSRGEIEQACEDIIDLVVRFCGGRLRYEVLSQSNPRIGLGE